MCSLVADADDYLRQARAFLHEGRARSEKTLAFGPHDGRTLRELGPLADVAFDPCVAILGGGPVATEPLLAGLRGQAEHAARESYAGIRVVADMNWLHGAAAGMEDIVAWELLGGRLLEELGASALCAYRPESFDAATVAAVLRVHPERMGHEDDPSFSLVAAGDTWRLAGEVDLRGADMLAEALAAAVTASSVIDVTDLAFIDVSGMRALAGAARSTGATLELQGASPSLRRHWRLASLDRFAPGVRLRG